MKAELEENLAVLWSNTCRRFSGNQCMSYFSDGEWRSLTFREVDEFVRNFALGLLALGYKPRQRLAILSENRPEWALVDLAVQMAGGVLVAMFSTNTPAQVGHVLKDSGSELLVVSNPYQLQKVLAAKEITRRVKQFIIFDPIRDLTDSDERVKSFDQVLNMGKGNPDAAELGRRSDNLESKRVATIIYTSGTTGDPKGVMLTHGNILSNVRAAQQLFQLRPNDVSLSILPLSHSLERTAGHFAVLFSGASITYAESIKNLLSDLQEVRPTALIGVPRVFEQMHLGTLQRVAGRGRIAKRAFDWALDVGRQAGAYRLEGKRLPAYLDVQLQVCERLVFRRVQDVLGGRLRFMISGGAPLSREVAEFFFCIGVPLYEGYGLTETAPIISANCPGNLRFGTVGKPIPGVEVRIDDDGEILVRGPNVMKGYCNLPEETRQVLAGGWFHTGDIGEMDQDGFLSITDRKKDIIVTSGGKNIPPQNIEALLAREKFIAQACVLGDRRPFLTGVIVPEFEEVTLWLKEQGKIIGSPKDMIGDKAVVQLIQESVDRVNENLARFETVSKFVLADVPFTVENGLLTPMQKVKRKDVLRLFSHQIDQLY